MKKLIFIFIFFVFILFIYAQSPNDYYYQGLDLESKGLIEEAVQVYTEGINLMPDVPELYNSRGIAYKKLRKYENAVKDYTKAIELRPTFVYAYNNRSIAYYFLKDYAKALADNDKAVHYNPEEAYYYFLNAIISSKISKKELKDSISFLKANMNLIKDNWAFNIAKYLTGGIKIKDLIKAADFMPERLCEAYCYIGYKSLFEKRKFRAKSYFKKSVKTNQKKYLEYEMSLYELKYKVK